eukprot:12899069-Prorocentrum_lima.AAC.1
MKKSMQEQGRAVIVHCRDNHCHEQQQVRALLEEGNLVLHTVLSCNIGLTHKQSSRPIKLKTRLITTAKLPLLDRCDCGHDIDQHYHVARSMFHSRTYEHHEIHAQANLAL